MLLAGSTSLLRSIGCGRKQLHLQGSKVFPNRFYSVDSLWPSAIYNETLQVAVRLFQY